jgi:tetratricopeptide (TPR) repeat protein
MVGSSRSLVVLALFTAGLPAASLTAAAPAKEKPAVRSQTEGSRVLYERATREHSYALKAMKVGNFTRARKHFEAAVRYLPAYPEAHLGLGHIAMTERRFGDALREYQAARDGYGLWDEILMNLQLLRYTDAQEEIRRLQVDLKSLSGVYGAKIGGTAQQIMILNTQNKLQRLESQRQPDTSQLPAVPAETHFYIGNALWRLERPAEALAEWQECAREDPRFAPVHNNLAVAYWRRGEIEQARSSLQRAEQLGVPVPDDFKKSLGP